ISSFFILGNLVPNSKLWRAESRRNHISELNETNETLKKEVSKDVSQSGCFYGLSPESILEFQKIALEVSGMNLTYEEAWKTGHDLVNFFDLLLSNDNDSES
ncbi:MAG: hypothetical protein WCI63_03135, partial [bacterium]